MLGDGQKYMECQTLKEYSECTQKCTALLDSKPIVG